MLGLVRAPMKTSHASKSPAMGLVRAGVAGVALVSAQACSQGPEEPEGRQRFLVGPSPGSFGGAEHRFLLELPRAYLPARVRPRGVERAEAAAVPFVARIADFAPAGDGPATAEGVFSGTVGWAPPGFVRRRVDGSWLNSFSQYSQPLGERYGLEVRTTPQAEVAPAKLYVLLSAGHDLMIECAYLPADRPQFCQMWSQRPGAPFVEIWFREEDLPNWRRIAGGIHELVKTWSLDKVGHKT